MSVLVVGVSHRSAPFELLARLALDGDGVVKLLDDTQASQHVSETAVIATCNRLEIYAEVDRFHGSVEDLSGLLVERSGLTAAEVVPHIYVHYDDAAVSHLFGVTAGLDSMAVGEAQILGQARAALRSGQEHSTVGASLNALFQQALRVGKRAHADTGIDHAAPSLVEAALDALGPAAPGHDEPVRGKVVVLGAGSIAALAVATMRRRGADDIVILNRTASRAERLATEYAARASSLSRLSAEVADADLIVSCTGASGVLLTQELITSARTGHTGPLGIVDLAVPHDVDPDVANHPQVTLVNLAGLGAILADTHVAAEISDVRTIVAEEVEAFLAARQRASVTPTVVALRSMATGVVDAEVARLMGRLPELDPEVLSEVRHTVRRVADKLLHQPTVRIKELAGDTSGAVSYTTALAELFALDPDAVDAVTRPEVAGD